MATRSITIDGKTSYNPQEDSTRGYGFRIDDNDKIVRISVELYNQGGPIWTKGDSEEDFIKVMNEVLNFNEEATLSMLSKLIKE